MLRCTGFAFCCPLEPDVGDFADDGCVYELDDCGLLDGAELEV